MVAMTNLERITDPMDVLTIQLEQIWHVLCCTYDASGSLPNFSILLQGANLLKPYEAAQTILANMLMEVMEKVGRFSYWYTRPARAFGLTSIRDPITHQNRWLLAAEAVYRWQSAIDSLAHEIEQNYSVLKAMLYVDRLMEGEDDENWVTVSCGCTPPRTFQISQETLNAAEIFCDACMMPFR